MERRTFLQSFSAALAAWAPALHAATGQQSSGAAQHTTSDAAAWEEPREPGMLEHKTPVYPVLDTLAGLAIQNITVNFTDPASGGWVDAEMNIRALCTDMEVVSVLMQAKAGQDALHLDTPLLRTLGVGGGLWVVASLMYAAEFDSLLVLNVRLRSYGTVSLITPTGEVWLPGMPQKG